MSIDEQELRAIAFLAERVRKATHGAGPWDHAGLVANLRKLTDRNLHMTIEHVLRHAADPKAKNPGVLAGSYTPPAPTSAGRPQPPRKDAQCSRCGGERPGCACTREDLAADAVDAYSDHEPVDLPPLADVNPGLAQRLADRINPKESA